MDEPIKDILAINTEDKPKIRDASAEGIEVKTHYMDDMSYHSMAEHFGLDFDTRRDPQMAEKLSFLADWAKERSGSQDQIEQYITLKSLTRTLGYQMNGPELIKKLYTWTRLDSQRKHIEKQMESII